MGLLSSSLPPYWTKIISCPVLISAIYIILSIFNPYGLSSFNQCNLYNSLTIFNPYGCSYNYILPLLVVRQINDYLFIYRNEAEKIVLRFEKRSTVFLVYDGCPFLHFVYIKKSSPLGHL